MKRPPVKKSSNRAELPGRVSFRFPDEVMRKLLALQKKKGVNRNSIAAIAIMEMAEREGL